MRLVPREPTGSSVSTPGFTSDSRSNSISLHRTRSRRVAHHFNANVAHGLTPSHSIPIPTDRHFKARGLGSSPSRPTTSYCSQNLQNDFQSLSACLIVLRTVLKNLSHGRGQGSRFFRGFDISFRLFQNQMSPEPTPVRLCFRFVYHFRFTVNRFRYARSASYAPKRL